MLRALTRFLTPSDEQRRVHRLYLALVEQSRNPFFYAQLGVPDTMDGRFELILLHAFLVLHRLKAAHGGRFDAEESGFERALIETLFADMDRSLREEGVGDTGVARRVKAMANAFYGRLAAYETAQDDEVALSSALARNLYGTTAPPEGAVARMAAYARQCGETLSARSIEQVQLAEGIFADPPIAGR